MKFLLSGLVLILFVGCASNARVVGKGKGKFLATSHSPDKERALNEAIDKANETCEDRGKITNVRKQSVKYKGELDEETNSAIKAGTRIAGVLGAGKAASAGYAATSDNEYHSKVLFTCE